MKSLWVRPGSLGGVVALALFSTATSAQSVTPPDKLTIHQMVERALSNHPRVGVARAETASAAAKSREARAGRFPSISVEAAATRFQEPMIVAPLHGFDPNVPPGFDETLIQSRWRLAYTVFDGGARGANIRASEAGFDAATSAAETARTTVIDRVASAFLDVLTARGVRDAESRRLESLEAEQARVQQLMEVGRAASVERLRVDAAVASGRAAQIYAEQELFTALREVARLTGIDTVALDPTAFLEVTVIEPVDPEPTEYLERAHEANPLLASARYRSAASGEAERAARAAWFPSLQIVGGVNTFADVAGDFTAEWQAGITLSYPIWTGGARSGRIAAATADARTAQEALRQTELDVATSIDRAIAAVRGHHARAEALALAVTHLTEVARIEQLALNAGSGVQTDYLRAEADLASARADEIRARHAEIMARIQLADATGDLSMDWLTQHLGVER